MWRDNFRTREMIDAKKVHNTLEVSRIFMTLWDLRGFFFSRSQVRIPLDANNLFVGKYIYDEIHNKSSVINSAPAGSSGEFDWSTG